MNPTRDALIIVGLILALAFAIAVIRSAGQFSSSGSGLNLGPRAPAIPVLSSGGSGSSGERTKSAAQLERERKKEVRTIEDQIETAQAEVALIEQELENIEKFGENSPYKGQIKIVKRSSTLKRTDVNDEYITLETSSNNTARIDLDGWRLESTVSNRSYEIPEAVHTIISGTTGTKQPVVASPGDKIHIITGRSPIGSSFRVNKCSGFFTQFQDFEPRIREICPDPEEEIFDFYTRDTNIFLQDSCLDYIDDLRKCEIVTNPLPLSLTPSCQEAIIEEVNYNACVENHKDDADFLVGEWLVYLRNSTETWRDKREFIKLLDNEGRTVDHYTY